MGANLTKCTVDDSFTFGCVANDDNGKEDVTEVYPSMDSVYPTTSTATFIHLRSKMQSPMRSPALSLKFERFNSSTLEDVLSPAVSPLSMASNQDFCYDDGRSSDTQSVMSIVSPTKDRRASVAPLNLRIPILRPAAGLHQLATITSRSDNYSQKTLYEQVHVENFFDAPMFEAKEALYTAILRGDLTAVQHAVEQQLPPVLVSHITWSEHRSDSALHLAVRSGHLQVVDYLIAKMDTALNARNEDGESALSLAGNLRQYEILAFLMRWVVDDSRLRHEQPGDDASIVSPYSPYASSSLQLRHRDEGSQEEESDVLSVLSVMMTKSVATANDDQPSHDDVPSDPNRVSNHLSRIFNEDEVMAWLTQLEEDGNNQAGAATSETEGDDRQSLASTLSRTSHLTMTDFVTYSAKDGKIAGKRKLPLPRRMRKAAGRAFRQIGRLTAMLPRPNTQHI